MTLLRRIFTDHPAGLLGVLGLSVASAVLSVGSIAFVTQRLLAESAGMGLLLAQYALLLAGLMVVTFAAQSLLHALGHHFVYRMRRRLVKQVLDTDIEQLERLGGPKLLAALGGDLRNVTLAFVHFPNLIHGVVLPAAALAYLVWLSPPLFLITAVCLAATIAIGALLVARVNHHIARVREADDQLYEDYQALIDGRKELALNRHRARRFFVEEFDIHARGYRADITRADVVNSLAGNIANIMLLGLIGGVVWLAVGQGWANATTGATFALVILFLRAPLVGAVAALPSVVSAEVSLGRLDALSLAEAAPAFEPPSPVGERWQRLQLCGVAYAYERAEPGDDPEPDTTPAFTLGPVDFRLERGELVFVVGGNGSGKSTFARVLTGLYRAQQGRFLVDDVPIEAAGNRRWQALFSGVFTDFHLFKALLDGAGDDADADRVAAWLDRLGLADTVGCRDARLTDTRLSQGQRKRLALMVAVLESRDVLVLDEWAADQDPQFRRFFYRELLPALVREGRTIVAITHDDHYFDVADRLVKVDGGRLEELTGSRRQRASRDAVAEIDRVHTPYDENASPSASSFPTAAESA